jgi:Holliday junction resolvase
MAIRGGNRFGIEIKRPRAERTYNEAVALERLVSWGRHMEASHARFEIVNTKRPRIVVAIPTDEI